MVHNQQISWSFEICQFDGQTVPESVHSCLSRQKIMGIFTQIGMGYWAYYRFMGFGYEFSVNGEPTYGGLSIGVSVMRHPGSCLDFKLQFKRWPDEKADNLKCNIRLSPNIQLSRILSTQPFGAQSPIMTTTTSTSEFAALSNFSNISKSLSTLKCWKRQWQEGGRLWGRNENRP